MQGFLSKFEKQFKAQKISNKRYVVVRNLSFKRTKPVGKIQIFHRFTPIIFNLSSNFGVSLTTSYNSHY